MGLLHDQIRLKQQDIEAAKTEADKHREALKREWQQQVDRAISLLQEMGVTTIQSPTFIENASATSIMFSVGEVPCSLLLQAHAISLYLVGNLIGEFLEEQQTAELLADRLANDLIAYMDDLNIEVVEAQTPSKRGRRNATPEAESE